MSSPPSSNFGDALLCPVCFIMYDGRILQCSQGHSICEKCHKKLSNECPQCRSSYVGTRNYVLEEMVKQLKHLKQISIGTANEGDKSKPSSSSGAAQTGDTNTSAEHPDVKVASLIANFLAAIPKPSSNDEDDDSATGAGPTSDTTQEERTGFLDATATIDLFRLAQMITVPTVVQAKGLFHCRMLDCDEKLPVCRLLNHLRSFHNDHLMQAGNDEEFIMHWSFRCNSYRHAIQIPKFGLFFFIVNVDKRPSKTLLTAWVQCVSPNNDARKFSFKLELRVGNSIASYSDFAYGASSGADYIETKKQCLTFETTQMAKQIKELAVDIKIYKTPGSQSVRRSSTTNIEIIPTATRAENPSNQQPASSGRSRNRRNRR